MSTKKNVVKVKVGNTDSEMFADSGADLNVAPHTWYQKEMGTLEPCNLTLSPYGTEEQLPVKGKFKTVITTEKGAQVETWIHLVKADGHFQPLLGDIDATALGLSASNLTDVSRPWKRRRRKRLCSYHPMSR